MKPSSLLPLLLLSGVMSLPCAVAQDTITEDKAPPQADSGLGPFQVRAMKCYAEPGAEGGKTHGAEIPDFTFSETQKKLFFDFEFEPGSESQVIDVKVFAAKTTIGINIPLLELSGSTDPKGVLPANWHTQEKWPVGLYTVKFTYKGKAVGTGSYLVKAAEDRESPLKATGVTLFSLKGGEAEEKEALTTADHSLIFRISTTGAYTKGAEVRMFLGQENEKGEKSIYPNSKVTVEDWPLEDTEILYSFELADGLPKGEYHLVVLVNGEELVAHPVKVAE